MPIATGTIYRIICLPEPNIQYIGSTFTTTKQRWAKHRAVYKQYKNGKYHTMSTHPYYDIYGIDNFKLIKIKEYQVWREHQKDNSQLRVYEQLWINRTKCINQSSAFQIKRYYNNEYVRRLDVKERNKISKKKYKSKPEVKEKIKEYEKKRKLIKINCPCGSMIRKDETKRHERTQKHIKYLESLN